MKKFVSYILVAALMIGACLALASCTDGEKTDDATKLVFELLEDYGGYSVQGIGEYKGNTLVIPSEYMGKPVVDIGVSAFEGCELLSITVPDTVKSIGARAFADCTSLYEVNLPDGVDALSHSLFAGCTSLAKVTLPKSVTKSEQSVFSGCIALKSVVLPEGMTEIGGQMFKGCTSLESIVIPEGVESIGVYAFRGCSALKSVTLPKSLESIKYRAFENCSALAMIHYAGTESEWNAIEARAGWDMGVGNYTVECTDKNITK